MPLAVAFVLIVLCALVLAAGGTRWWIRRRFLMVVIDGPSMEPTLRAGQHVVARRGTAGLGRADIVVMRYPEIPPPDDVEPMILRNPATPWGPCLIKRVAALPGDPVPRELVPALRDAPEDVVPPGKLVLLGDNPDSSFDSRQHGYYLEEHVLGVVRRSSSHISTAVSE